MVVEGGVEAHGEHHLILVVIKRVHEGIHRFHWASHGHEVCRVHSCGDSVVVSRRRGHEVDGRGLELAAERRSIVGIHVHAASILTTIMLLLLRLLSLMLLLCLLLLLSSLLLHVILPGVGEHGRIVHVEAGGLEVERLVAAVATRST